MKGCWDLGKGSFRGVFTFEAVPSVFMGSSLKNQAFYNPL